MEALPDGNILTVVAKRFLSAEVLLTTRSSNRLWDLTLELLDEARGIYDTSFPSFMKRDDSDGTIAMSEEDGFFYVLPCCRAEPENAEFRRYLELELFTLRFCSRLSSMPTVPSSRE